MLGQGPAGCKVRRPIRPAGLADGRAGHRQAPDRADARRRRGLGPPEGEDPPRLPRKRGDSALPEMRPKFDGDGAFLATRPELGTARREVLVLRTGERGRRPFRVPCPDPRARARNVRGKASAYRVGVCRKVLDEPGIAGRSPSFAAAQSVNIVQARSIQTRTMAKPAPTRMAASDQVMAPPAPGPLRREAHG